MYQSIDLPPAALAPGDTFVVCANSGLVPNCDWDVAPDTNLIQNGAPDAVALRWMGGLEDAVSYEGTTGAPYYEGAFGLLFGDGETSPGVGIARTPDGQDTDDNSAAFTLRAITAGIPTPGPPAAT